MDELRYNSAAGTIVIWPDYAKRGLARNEIRFYFCNEDELYGVHVLREGHFSGNTVTYSKLENFFVTYGEGSYLGVIVQPIVFEELKADAVKLRAFDVTRTPTAPRCECGAEKCGSRFHSSWCPKK